MTFIEGYDTGDTWEKLIVSCYHLHYQNDHYTPIPATHDGDAGIEGFTQSGVVHQSYCPERSYTDKEHYEHLRKKLTADITKLMNNASRLSKLGVPPITEWHFNIPEYRDARILSHAQKKQQEVLKAKKDKPADFIHISDGFKIIIKTVESFAPEIARLYRNDLMARKLSIPINMDTPPDWTKCDSEKVSNIRRKIKAVMLVSDDADERLNHVVKMFIEHYMRGIEIMTRLRAELPEVYEDILKLERSYKGEVSRTTNMNIDQTLNKSIFDGILNEFQSKLERKFSKMIEDELITELRNEMVGKWLADCDMEFRSVGDGQ